MYRSVAVDIYRSGEYLEKNPGWHQEDNPWKADNVRKILQKNHVAPRNVADIGCGSGRLLFELSKLYPDDIQFCGFDISPQAIEMAREYEKENLIFRQADVSDFRGMFFDLALVIDVFEHVEDYIGFLRALRGIASHYVFHIPLDLHVRGLLTDQQIMFRDSVGHLHYFSKETALRTITDAGYRVVDWFYTRPCLELQSRRRTAMAKVGYFLRGLTFPVSADLTVKIFGGFEMMVLAR